MIKKLLTTLFFVLIHSLVSAQTNTYTGANGSWIQQIGLRCSLQLRLMMLLYLLENGNIFSNSFTRTVSRFHRT
jgi:hypothetical protein